MDCYRINGDNLRRNSLDLKHNYRQIMCKQNPKLCYIELKIQF